MLLSTLVKRQDLPFVSRFCQWEQVHMLVYIFAIIIDHHWV